MLTLLQIDWQAATVAFGAASVESMRVMVRNTLKKVKNPDDGNGKVASPGVGADSGIDNTPKKNPAAKKRKAAGREDDDGVENPKTPRGRKPKGAAMACTEGWSSPCMSWQRMMADF